MQFVRRRTIICALTLSTAAFLGSCANSSEQTVTPTAPTPSETPRTPAQDGPSVETPTETAPGASTAPVASTESSPTGPETTPATQRRASTAAAAPAPLPAPQSICGLVSLDELEAIFGMAFATAEPQTIGGPDFPGCRWKTIEVAGLSATVQVSICCPKMTPEQIAASLPLAGAKEIDPTTFGAVTDFGVSINTYRKEVFFAATAQGFGEPNEFGSRVAGSAQLEQLQTFVDLIGNKL